MIALLILSACTSPKGRPPPAAVDTTGADTGATTGSTTSGPDDRPFLPPSARILSTEDLEIATEYVALLPAHGADPGLILVTAWSDAFGDHRYVLDPTLVLPGDPAPGDHVGTAVWDGVSRIDEEWPRGSVVNAGDVDGDGHLDLWYGDTLLRGPLLGRAFTGAPEDALATLDGENAVAGDFDADGDGEIDVVAQSYVGNQAFVRYGPLAGPIPSASDGVAAPATYSSLGEELGCLDITEKGTWLRDHFGLGHHAVAVGIDMGACSYDTFVWDPFVPPGTHRRYEQAIGVLTHWPTQFGDVAVHDPGDVDRDGHPDVIFEYQGGSQLIPGPLAGVYDTFTDLGFWDQMVDGRPSRSMGDVNGDGAPELIAQWLETAPGAVGWTRNTWVLMCSPFNFPLDFSQGIPLVDFHGGPFWMSSFIGMDSADLDGDGLHDLVDTRTGQEPGGLSIWYGKDLAAACEAQPATSID